MSKKMPVKLVSKEREQLLKSIKSKYAFLNDDLPLEGWFWEIVRRHQGYRNVYDKFVRGDKYIFLREKVGGEPCFIFDLNEVNREHYAMQPFFDHGEDKLYIAYPNPEIRYIDFKAPLPIIHGISPVVCCTHDHFKSSFKDALISILDESATFDEKLEAVLSCLVPTNPEDTLFVGVSRTAKIDDIERTLIPAIRNYLKKKTDKVRDDKWAYYLIAYDLKKEYGKRLSYPQIGDLLYQAYPVIKVPRMKDGKKVTEKVDSLVYFDKRNAERFYEVAHSLIDGGFKRYLY